MKNQSKKTRKFCILTTQRSGSTWLSTLLDSNSKIQGFRELFIDQEFIFPDSKLSTFLLYQKNNSGNRPGITFKYLNKLDDYLEEHDAIGFKLMYDQLLDYPEIILRLVDEKYKIIHLVRENYLDTVISGKIKDELGVAHTKVKIEPKKVYLEPFWLIKNLKKRDRKRKVANMFLAIMPNQVLNITYDNLCIDRAKTLKLIADFLNLNSSEKNMFNSDLKKINSKSHQEMIQNYEQVKSALSGTKFFDFLN
ncbi:MAG: sulfotransferase domain-containing protein [Waterburya sp.]